MAGWVSSRSLPEPEDPASPKERMPPSMATSQQPLLSGVAGVPVMGRFSRRPPVEP
jgi:hypothetical protein